MRGSIKHIHWVGKFLILLGVYMIGEYIFLILANGVVQLIYPEADFLQFLKSLGSITDVEQISEAQINALKVYQFITSVGRFIIVSIFFLYLCGDKIVEALQMNKSIQLVSAGIILLLFFVSAPLVASINEWNQNIKFPEGMASLEKTMRTLEENGKMLSDAFLNTTSISGLFLNILLIGVVTAFAEEIFFRGVLQNLFIKGTGNAHVGIWAAAFLFSFIHFQFFGFFPRMLLGAMIGYLFYWSGSLWAAILAHFFNNTLAVIAYYLVNIGLVNENLTEQTNWIAALVSVPFVILLLIAFKRRQKPILVNDGAGLDDGIFNNG